MTEYKWLKLAAEIFDNRKIKQIESLPEGDGLLVIWIKLLCLAANVNDNGWVYFTPDIPYTEQMLATQFGRPLTLIQTALSVFQRFQMIEVVEDVLKITNWEKYQAIEENPKQALDAREQVRQRVAKFRENKRMAAKNTDSVYSNADLTQSNAFLTHNDALKTCENAKNVTCNADVTPCNVTCNADVTPCNVTCNADVTLHKEKGEEKERTKEKEEEKETEVFINSVCSSRGETPHFGSETEETDIQPSEAVQCGCPVSQIVDLYHRLCPSYPRLRVVEGGRRKAINARWRSGFTLDTFQELFERAEASDFLRGANDRNWSADFDWIIKATNAAKILEGKYDKRAAPPTLSTQPAAAKRCGAISTLQRLYEEAQDE